MRLIKKRLIEKETSFLPYYQFFVKLLKSGEIELGHCCTELVKKSEIDLELDPMDDLLLRD